MKKEKDTKSKEETKKEKPSKIDWIALFFSILALIVNLIK